MGGLVMPVDTVTPCATQRQEMGCGQPLFHQGGECTVTAIPHGETEAETGPLSNDESLYYFYITFYRTDEETISG